MPDIQVSLFIKAGTPDGTNLWATEKVIDLVAGFGEITDTERVSLYFRKLVEFCNANFRQYMPDIIKREHGKVYCIHLDYFRIVGFFDQSYRDFIAVDYFQKKKQRNDRRMNAIYKRAEQARENTSWRKSEE